jgi:feruloyl-CoA hydratase/lyase
MTIGSWETVRVSLEDGVAWVELNRPEKRNAMSPTLNGEMIQVLEALDAEEACGVVVLTGAGDAFSAGMDLKEYFREVDQAPEHVQRKVRRDAAFWQWRLLRNYAKPTIAMVNGWCFGGAFTPLVACDLAVAADEATFGLSEINFKGFPGGAVSKSLANLLRPRDALFYAMTGRRFGGHIAADIGLVNFSVPLERLREETLQVARDIAGKDPHALRATKEAYRFSLEMTWEASMNYTGAKEMELHHAQDIGWRDEGVGDFVKGKFKPGLEGHETIKNRKA